MKEMLEFELTAPVDKKYLQELNAGDLVRITGTIYAARDAAHERFCRALAEGKKLPIPLEGTILYYLGPSPAREGRPVGAAGPTTSGRMDRYTPQLLERGLAGMIGKGRRSPEVMESIRENGAVYFAAVGGAAALISGCIKEAKIVAYEDLGPEAVRELKVKDFPVIVAADAHGGDLYEEAVKQYGEQHE